MRVKLRILFLTSATGLAIATGWWLIRAAPAQLASSQRPAKGDTVEVPVSAIRASRQDVPVFFEGLGSVQAFNTVTIRSQVDGQVRQIAFKEGQDVQPGDLLAQIDARTYQAAVDQAVAKKAQDEAQLANDRADLQRYSDLAAKSYATRQQVDTTRALVNQLQAAVQGDQAAIENARVQLDYTAIRSPIAGRVGIRQVDIGNIVHSADSTGLVVITQMRPISVIFTLPEDDLPVIAEAMQAGPVPLTVWSRTGKRQLDAGSLALVDNQIDQTTGTIKLKATLPNGAGKLWPGQFVNARLQVGVRHQVVGVPVSAVLRGPEGAYTFVVKADATVEMRKLTLSETSEGIAIVEDGLDAGETVVTDGQYRLQSGTRVAVKPAAGQPEAAR